MGSSVVYESRESVAIFTIDWYEQRNAIDHQTGDELYDALMRFNHDEDAAVGIITTS
jgi:enoyl-CoA hydratase/carnithine racemase